MQVYHIKSLYVQVSPDGNSLNHWFFSLFSPVFEYCLNIRTFFSCKLSERDQSISYTPEKYNWRINYLTKLFPKLELLILLSRPVVP